MPVYAEDLKRVRLIKAQRLATLASGVADTIGSDTVVVRVVRGTLSTAGCVARLFSSDTLSTTVSAMDNAGDPIATAGTTLSASGTSYAWILDKPKRFIGLVLSARTTASGNVAAELDMHGNKEFPVSSTLGFTAVARVPSGA